MLQALANVLSTAIRLSPAGSSIETGVVEVDGQAEIRITATGAQVTQDELNTLFDRYQQSGTGMHLELPISKEIVRLHGGTMEATRLEPQGLTFTVHLPSKGST
jgi:two-component system sensor histidine kinase BaeS